MKTRTVVFACVSLLALVSLNLQRLPRMFGERSYEAGREYLNAGQYRNAADAFRRASLFMPGEQRPYVDLGDALLQVEQYEAARASFKKALDLKEDSCALCGLGAVYYRTGRYEEAERAFRRAEGLSPNDECAYDWSGRMYYDLERYEEAAEAFEHEVKIVPRAVTPLHFLGNCYGYLGRWDEAAEIYRRVISIQPDYEDAHYQLGVALFDVKQYRDAVVSYRNALELKSDDARAVYHLALAHCALGEQRSAEAYYERLRALDPAAAADLSRRMDCGASAARR